MAYTAYVDLPYIVQTTKLDRWGIPTDPAATRDAEILKHANRAASIIHGYLAKRYGQHLPFTTPPQMVKDISLDLTLYFMASTQPIKGEIYQELYDGAMALLKEVAQYRLDIFDNLTDTRLTEFDATYGIDDNHEYSPTDEEEDEYRIFPRSLLGKPPSSEVRTYRDSEE